MDNAKWRLEVSMAEKNARRRHRHEDAPGENTVQVTFLPRARLAVSTRQDALRISRQGRVILDVALNHHIKPTNACGGNNACTTCHIWVKRARESFAYG